MQKENTDMTTESREFRNYTQSAIYYPQKEVESWCSRIDSNGCWESYEERYTVLARFHFTADKDVDQPDMTALEIRQYPDGGYMIFEENRDGELGVWDTYESAHAQLVEFWESACEDGEYWDRELEGDEPFED